jgi:signal transduction histidine kinase
VSDTLTRAGAHGRYEPPFLASGVTFLAAARIPAWVIAAAAVAIDTRPEPNLRYEPQLILLTLLHVNLLIFYAPILRPLLRRWTGLAMVGRRDLLVVSALDMLASFAVLYYSGGMGTPYYHFAVVALLIPTFLLGWRGSLSVLAVFLVALVATWEYAGFGHQVWASRSNLGGSVPGLLLTPVLVVLVAQYLGWLARRAEAARIETAVSLERIAALHAVAEELALPRGHDPQLTPDLAQLVAGTLRSTGRFQRFSVARVDQLEVLEGHDREGDGDVWRVRTGADEAEWLAIPFGAPGEEQRAFIFSASGERDTNGDVQLVRAAARQLTVALSRLALAGERDMLVAAEERSRIAREIHDGIAQSIYMLSLQLDRLSADAPAGSHLATRLEGLTALSKEALVDVRQYIFDVKPLLAGDSSLVETMRRQAEEFSTVAEVPVTVGVSGEEPALPIETRSAVYRIAQEALANAVRHARATRIELDLDFSRERVRLKLADDGIGFDLEGNRPGHGLANIQRRVEELSGWCRVTSTPGSGTVVSVEIPLSVETVTA